MLGGNKLRVLTFTLPLSLSSRSPLCSLSQRRPPRVVCLCVRVCAVVDQMHSVRQSVAAGCSMTLSSHYGSHTLTHGLCLRGGQHTETVVPTHTLIKTMYLSEERTLSWDTHTGDGGLSPCPCAGQPNYLSAPHCFPSVLSLFVRFAALSFSSFIFFGPFFLPSLHLIDQ